MSAVPSLKFSLEWEDPLGARGDTLRATWARMGVMVGDVCVTEFFDAHASTVRRTIYTPAYPLAEWIATQWWALTHEAARPASGELPLRERHDISTAREGFALPALSFFPQGDWVRVAWEAFSPKAVAGRFIATPGVALLSTETVIEGLSDFVETVIARLDARGITDTLLHNAWSWVQASMADGEEHAFCVAAGMLGLDPYGLEDGEAEKIEAVNGLLPVAIHQEFYRGAPVSQVLEEARGIAHILQNNLLRIKPNRHIATYAGRGGSPEANALAWEAGYALARAFRADGGSWRKIKKKIALEEVPQIGTGKAFSGVAELGRRLVVVTERKTDSSQNFIRAQAFCEQLSQAEDAVALIGRAQTDRQARNRAFAAELLAPADEIRTEISSKEGVDSDEIDRLSEHFGVSEWVIEHQIRNHQLASVF